MGDILINFFWIEIKGKNLKYILSKIFKLDINILNIKYYDNRVLLKVSYDDYKKIKTIKTTYEINIIKTSGKKKFYDDFFKYKTTIISFIISVFFVILLSNFVFFIDIETSNNNLKNIIRKELNYNDITLFSIKKSYSSLNNIKTNIRNNHKDNIEWIEIENDGVVTKVKVIERIKRDINSDNEYKDIVAEKDGFIRKIYSNKGQLLKNIDDYVRKGEVIISGNIFRNDEVIDKVHASGKVYAEVWYVVKVNGDIKYQTLEEDKGYFKLTLKTNGKEFDIFKIRKDVDSTKINKLFNNKFFSLYFENEKVYNKKEASYSDNELKKILEVKAKKSILDTLEKDECITYQKTLKKVKENGKMYIEVFFKVYEDIAKEENIKEIEDKTIEKED